MLERTLRKQFSSFNSKARSEGHSRIKQRRKIIKRGKKNRRKSECHFRFLRKVRKDPFDPFRIEERVIRRSVIVSKQASTTSFDPHFSFFLRLPRDWQKFEEMPQFLRPSNKKKPQPHVRQPYFNLEHWQIEYKIIKKRMQNITKV